MYIKKKDHSVNYATTELAFELEQLFRRDDEGMLISELGGYWSNLSKEENRALIGALKEKTAREALLEHQPLLETIIYSPRRQAGLELLQLKGNETCIDYGCMWGALTIPLAKRTRYVLGVDQTLDSLRFLKARAIEENVPNIDLLNHDIREMPILSNKVDVAIVNGVLEWIPERDPVELRSHYERRHKKEYPVSPFVQQKNFLQRVHSNLKDGGKLYLAIENRYDFKIFFGARDPHTSLLFATFLPRNMANWISMLGLSRPYVNWLYSFNGISLILKESGFSEVDMYMCFPDYRYPERIMPCEGSLASFKPTISNRNSEGKIRLRRILARKTEHFIFKTLQVKLVAPSIIAVAYR